MSTLSRNRAKRCNKRDTVYVPLLHCTRGTQCMYPSYTAREGHGVCTPPTLHERDTVSTPLRFVLVRIVCIKVHIHTYIQRGSNGWHINIINSTLTGSALNIVGQGSSIQVHSCVYVCMCVYIYTYIHTYYELNCRGFSI